MKIGRIVTSTVMGGFFFFFSSLTLFPTSVDFTSKTDAKREALGLPL